MTTTRKMPPQKPGRSKQDYATPANFIAAVKKRFGVTAFAYDLAADHENAKAEHFFHEEEDSLKQDWTKLESDLWLNPPFGKIDPWAAKCAATRQVWLRAQQDGTTYRPKMPRIFFLVPLGTTNWFVDHVFGKAREFRLHGRLSFDGKDPYPKDVALYVYGEAPGVEVWKWEEDALYGVEVWKWEEELKANLPAPDMPTVPVVAAKPRRKRRTAEEIATAAEPRQAQPLPVPVIPEAWAQPERLDRLQVQLAEHHVKVTMIDLCSWTPEQRQQARAWMMVGNPSERPAFFPSACAACDRGETFTSENAFKHTGMGPKCDMSRVTRAYSGYVDPQVTSQTPPMNALDAMRAKAKQTNGDSKPVPVVADVACSACGGPVQERSSSRVGDKVFCSAKCALTTSAEERTLPLPTPESPRFTF